MSENHDGMKGRKINEEKRKELVWERKKERGEHE